MNWEWASLLIGGLLGVFLMLFVLIRSLGRQSREWRLSGLERRAFDRQVIGLRHQLALAEVECERLRARITVLESQLTGDQGESS